MGASLKVNLDILKYLSARFKSQDLINSVMDVPREPAVAALIGQSIADNFDQNGPGWPPLKLRDGRPLQKSGLLKKSATTPNAPGNIYRVQGPKITWGTNLMYAGIQNNGGVVSAKNAKALFIPISKKGMRIGPQKDPAARKKNKLIVGKDMIFKKSVMIPAREFMTIRALWMQRIYDYVVERYLQILAQRIMG